MDKKDKQIESIFDSMHHLPKVKTPDDLFSKIENKIDQDVANSSNTHKYWQYAAAIFIAINTLAYLFTTVDISDTELSNQYEEYETNYNWSQDSYYEYLTLSE